MKRSPFFIGFLAVFLVAIFVSSLIYFNLILPQDAFHWDEAHHASYGVWLLESLKHGDWDSFWFWTHRQTLWPFFHSWLLAICFFIFGISFQTARFMSLALFFATVISTYLVSDKISQKWGRAIGLIACALVLTSPLMISFSAQNMLEGLGGLIFILAVYAYLFFEEKKQWYGQVLLGVLLGLSVVTKYNYAYLILGSFATVKCFELYGIYKAEKADKSRRKNKERAAVWKEWLLKNTLVLAPILIISLAWFLSDDVERKVSMLFWSKQMVAEQQGILSGFWQNILFYPKAIINDYVFSPWLGILVLVSLFLPFVFFRFKKLSSLYVITWVSLLLSVFTIGNRMNRLIYIFMPLVFIIFASVICCFMELLLAQRGKRKIAGAVVLGVLFSPLMFSLPRIPRMLSGDIREVPHGIYVSKKSENMAAVLDYFRRTLPPRQSFSTAVSLGVMSPYAFYFYFHDWGAPFFTRFQAGAPQFFQSAYYLTLELDQSSPYRENILEDSVETWNRFLKENVKQKKLQVFSQKKFDTMGVTAKIYKVRGAGK